MSVQEWSTFLAEHPELFGKDPPRWQVYGLLTGFVLVTVGWVGFIVGVIAKLLEH